METNKKGLSNLRNKVVAIFGSALAAITGILSTTPAVASEPANPSLGLSAHVERFRMKAVPVLKLNLNKSADSQLIASHRSHSSHSSHKSHSSHRSRSI